MTKSTAWSIAKYLLAAILLYAIFTHAEPDKIMGYLKRIPPLQLLLAFILISLAQIASAFRMRYFFRASGFHMNMRFAIILYYVGAFYNFLLPGGIGGDAYKVILARKRMSITAKQGIRIMLADRASGLCVIMLMFFGGLLTMDFSQTIPYSHLLIVAGIIITLLGYIFFSHWLLLQRARTMLWSLSYSLVTQGWWIMGLLTVWQALGTGRYAVEYIVLYCAASITGMLPVSVGGLGIKEVTYYYGAQLLTDYGNSHVSGDLGIAISLCLFFLMLATSMPGLLWLGKVEKAEYQ